METITEKAPAASVQELKSKWEVFKTNNPKSRIRDAAKALEISEAELLATGIGENVIRLECDGPALLQRFPELGHVMSLTRNEACVLEHKADFQKINIMDNGPQKMATVIGPIETRVFFSGWEHAFAVTTESPNGVSKSIQIFDKAGNAVTKIFTQGEKTNLIAFEKLAADFRSANQQPGISTQTYEPARYSREIDLPAFRKAWSEMKDTHEFFGLLRKFRANRLDAVRWAGNEYCTEISKSDLQPMLEKAAGTELPIMIFAGNIGNLQIHQGKIRTIRVMEKWLNVLDPDFNMHLNLDEITSAWIVKKPTTDGIVTGVECFDKDGELMVQFFGLRKPGVPEKEEWRKLLSEIEHQ